MEYHGDISGWLNWMEWTKLKHSTYNLFHSDEQFAEQAKDLEESGYTF